MSLLTRLKSLEPRFLKKENVAKVKARSKANPSFVPSEVVKQSVPAKSLCEWVLGLVEFYEVNKEIERKKEISVGLSQELEKMQKVMQAKEEQLSEVQLKVAELSENYERNKQERDKLEQELIVIKERLERANELTEGLSEEAVRWKDTIGKLEKSLVNVMGNIFLGCSGLNYFGPFPNHIRKQIVLKWVDKCKEYDILNEFSMVDRPEEKFTLASILAESREIEEWKATGLPSDNFSLDNGLLALKSETIPFLVDPEGQACKWLKCYYNSGNLLTLKFNSEQYIKQVEGALRLGTIVIIEDMDENLDSELDPILAHNYTEINGKRFVKMGDNLIEMHEKFRMFLICKQRNPRLLP